LRFFSFFFFLLFFAFLSFVTPPNVGITNTSEELPGAPASSAQHSMF
jgi:hypothetical protein